MGLLDSVLLLFAIVDAPGNLPVFIELTSAMDPSTRRRVHNIATVAGLGIIVGFSLAGRFVLSHVFQITVSEFQIAGGVLLVAVGVTSMLGRERTNGKPALGIEVAAVPIACPLLVGPGAIVTSMLIVERSGVVHALLAAVIVFVLVRLILALDEPIRRLVGRLGLMILSRIMHIFIVAIGVHFVLAGVRTAFEIGK